MSTGALRSRLMGVMRRGPRTVLWTDEQFGGGNLFYQWMHADLLTRSGEPTVCLRTEKSRYWLARLPVVERELTIERSNVAWNDRRLPGGFFQWGVHFDANDVHAFCSERLLPSDLLRDTPSTHLGPRDVVLNVRRGDYYSEPRWRARYAFDIAAFVREAVRAQRDVGGQIPRLHIVSDDVGWCRDHLGFLAGCVGEVTHAAPGEDPQWHLATLAGARRMILGNSSFSYWGAYLSTTRHGDNHADVVAPWFHARGDGGDQKAVQLDPRWTVIRSLPDGWDPLPEDAVDSS